jgi:hypothetical protein
MGRATWRCSGSLNLALRIGELARLDVADVEQKTGRLWIFGKGRKVKELVTMPQTSREAVRTWLTVRGTKPGPLFLSMSPANWPRPTRDSRCLPHHPGPRGRNRRPRPATRHPPYRYYPSHRRRRQAGAQHRRGAALQQASQYLNPADLPRRTGEQAGRDGGVGVGLSESRSSR